MHIPDGMLDTRTWAGAWIGAGGALGYATRWVRKNVPSQRVVLMAVMAALVFALQMLNFPVAGGTSGHFAGGAAVAILLGPWPAAIVLTTVLVVQATVFADGGVTALGANILNMAVIGPFVGYAVWQVVRRLRRTRRGALGAAFVAAWTAAVVSAMAAAVEIWLSGRAPLALVAGAMAFWHALTGIGEGVITAGLVGYVLAVRPDLVEGARESGTSGRRIALGLGLAALVAAGLSVFASRHPDALEFISARQRIAGTTGGSLLRGPLGGYLLPGITDQAVAGVLAGIVGVAISGALLAALFWRRPSAPADTHAETMHGHPHAHDDEAAHRHPHHHDSSVPAARESAHAHAHALSFERLTYVVSPVHDLDPRAKVVSAGVLVLGAVLAPVAHAPEFALMAGLLLAVALLARLPLRPLLLRSLLVLPIAGSVALLAPVQTAWSGAGAAAGWLLAWSIVTKAWFSASVMLLLAATTPPARLFAGLRALRLPAIFLTMLTFLYRYADALADQLRSMRRAVSSRGAGLSARRQVALYGNLAGSLFVRAYERGERIHASMVSRGYDGSLPTGETLHLGPADLLTLTLALFAAAAIVLY